MGFCSMVFRHLRCLILGIITLLIVPQRASADWSGQMTEFYPLGDFLSIGTYGKDLNKELGKTVNQGD